MFLVIFSDDLVMMELYEEMKQVEVIRSEGDYKCDHYKEIQVSDH